MALRIPQSIGLSSMLKEGYKVNKKIKKKKEFKNFRKNKRF